MLLGVSDDVIYNVLRLLRETTAGFYNEWDDDRVIVHRQLFIFVDLCDDVGLCCSERLLIAV
jgi:hypothetical protein